MGDVQRKIIIADKQFLVTEALQSILGKTGLFSDIGIVGSKRELVKRLEVDQDALLIIDPALFDFDGLDDLKAFHKKFPQLPILILTNSLTKTEFGELSKIGVKNMIYKTADKNEVLAAVESALKGKKYFSEEILDLILELNENKVNHDEPKDLTPSEVEIVKMISGGLTTKEIANKKNISFHTANTHRKNIFRKMKVNSTSELIMHAIKAGWIDNIEYYI
jgi:Response regulator containing a CheY-like receiver domain and an HTH DNA-binding domain